MVRAPRTTLCPSWTSAYVPPGRKVSGDRCCLGIKATVLLFAAGVWSFSKPWTPQEVQASGRSGMRPGRVTLGKGGEVFPVGSCLATRGATTRPAKPNSGQGRGHTEVPEAQWALDAATCVVLPLQPASGRGKGGFESGPALQRGFSWRFAAMVGRQQQQQHVCMYVCMHVCM